MEKELILTKQEGNNFTFDGLPDTESNKVKQTLATESSAKEVLLKGDGASGADAYAYYSSGVNVYPTYGELSANIVEGSISMATKTDANLAVPERKGRNQEKLVDYFWLENSSSNLPTSYHSIIMTLTNQNKANWTITQLCYPNKNGASTSEIHMRIGQSTDSGSTITWSSWSSVGGGSSDGTTYTFTDGTDGSFSVTPSGGSAQKVSIGKPATAGTADAATSVVDYGDTSRTIKVGWAGNGVSSIGTSGYIACYTDVTDGGANKYIKDVKAENVTVGAATKATQDASGNVITTTYATKSEVTKYINVTNLTTTILAQVKGLVNQTDGSYVREAIIYTTTDGGANNISDRPVSGTSGPGFACLVHNKRFASKTDYCYDLECYCQGIVEPYYTQAQYSSTSLTWSSPSLKGHKHTKSEISDFPTSMTPSSHSHGNIANGGTLTNETTIASTDRIVLTDASDSYKIISDDQNAVANSLLNSLSTGTSDPSDADYYISQYAGGGTTTTTYHRRPVSKLWNYIKSKIGTYITGGTQTTTSTASGGSNVYTFYKSDGTTSTLTVKNGTNGTNATTTSVATSSANGLCPKLPTESSTTSFLRGDGTWATPTDNNDKVTQKVTSTGMTKVLLSYNTAAYNSDITDGATNTVKYSNKISASPGYGELYASGFSGSTFAGVAASADEAVPNLHTRNQSHLCNTYWVQYTSSANLPTSYHSIIQTYTYQSGANWVVTQLCYPHKAGATYTKMHIRGGSSTDSGSTFTWTSWVETYTDENVKQIKNSGSSWRSLLLGIGALGTDGTTAVADTTGSTLCASNIMAKPSTGSLHANIYQSGTSSTGWYIGKLTANTTTSATYGPSGSLNLGYGGTDTAKRVVLSTNGDVVASGGASFKGSVGVGRTHSATAQSGGCLMTYNSSTDSLDFTFPSV